MLRGPCKFVLMLLMLLAGTLGLAGNAGAQGIDVKLLHFGVGDVARGGDPLAMQLEFRSSLERVVEVEAVWELPNADLDITEFSRSFVLNPGQPQRRWLYGVLPPMGEGMLGTAVFDLRLYEVRGGVRVRDLGTARIGPGVAENSPRLLSPEVDAILVVGSRTLGLDVLGPTARGTHPAMHGATLVANLRDADAFPDRWEGFAQFETIIWASGAIVPSRLSEESARAITEWVERGGSLVIALPAAGDPWAIGSNATHALSGVLPPAAPRRIDDVRVRDMIQLLSVRDDLRDPEARIRIAAFDEAELKGGWRPFIAVPARRGGDGAPIKAPGLPDGELIGVRRALGFGNVTVIGLDVDELAARSLQVPPIPNVDVFWNRVLGRRADTPGGTELDVLDKADRLTKPGGFGRAIDLGRAVSSQIGLSGQAAVGVLAAMGVFALYWLLAGPLGFALLKAAKRERWSWVVYVAVAALFSGSILAVGGLFAGRKARIQHMTVLDMVEPAQGEANLSDVQRKRALGWFSLFAPNYGTVEVALDPKGDASVRNRLTSWRAASSEVQGFPSRERYRAPIDDAARLDVPSRATSIDFESRWLGAVDPKWGLFPRPTTPVSVSIDRSTSPATISVKGELVHGLPGTLRDVMVLHVWPVRNALPTLAADGKVVVRRQQGQLPNRGSLVMLADWASGTKLDLGTVLPPRPVSDRGLQGELNLRYYDTLYSAARNIAQGLGITSDTVDPELAVEILGFYSMMPPPPYIQGPPNDVKVLRISRGLGRELDLSDWFTEPCIVVIGRLDAVPLPYPVTVDGETVPSTGSVYVRWVLPLPDATAAIVPERIVRDGTTRDAIRDGASGGDAGDGSTEKPAEPTQP